MVPYTGGFSIINMLSFYWRLFLRLPHAVWTQTERLHKVVFLIALLVAASGAAFDWEHSRVWAQRLLVVLFVYALLRTNYSRYRDLEHHGDEQVAQIQNQGREIRRLLEELSDYRNARVALVFEPDRSPYFQETPVGTGTATGVHRLFRVGLKNLSRITLTGVKVLIVNREPGGIAFAPVPLRLMHDHSGESSRDGFDVNPGDVPTRFVDVVAKYTTTIFDALHDQDIQLQYAVEGIPNLIPKGRYSITVVVEGTNIPPVSQRYTIDVAKDGLLTLQIGD